MAECELNWNRGTIRKGLKEIETGIDCIDNFGGRGRKRTEEHLPNLADDICDIVNPSTQTDPTFRTTKLYSPLTAEEVYARLIQEKGYTEKDLPTPRTIRTKLNNMNFHPQKVTKSKPLKKIPETDDIFDNVHHINKLADETEGVVRMSIDSKATINIGHFSRGGYNRTGVQAADHDFAPDMKLNLFGIFLPAYDETCFYFTESSVTADFIIDAIEDMRPSVKERFAPHTIVINADNGPENNSRRTQFIKRLVDFAKEKQVCINLAYYPPYHSKYNPIERVWGTLENHWNGEIPDSPEKVMGLAGTMKWNGIKPVINMVRKTYEKGVTLGKKAMEIYEDMIIRQSGLEKWFVDILCYDN